MDSSTNSTSTEGCTDEGTSNVDGQGGHMSGKCQGNEVAVREKYKLIYFNYILEELPNINMNVFSIF